MLIQNDEYEQLKMSFPASQNQDQNLKLDRSLDHCSYRFNRIMKKNKHTFSSINNRRLQHSTWQTRHQFRHIDIREEGLSKTISKITSNQRNARPIRRNDS